MEWNIYGCNKTTGTGRSYWGGNSPQESKIVRVPKTERNRETGTKRYLRPLDAFYELSVCPECISSWGLIMLPPALLVPLPCSRPSASNFGLLGLRSEPKTNLWLHPWKKNGICEKWATNLVHMLNFQLVFCCVIFWQLLVISIDVNWL